MKLDKLTFYRRWAELISVLSDAERLEVYDAVVKYGLDDEEATVSTNAAQKALNIICSEIDDERRHKNAVAKSRSRAGKLGGKLAGRGRPKQHQDKPLKEVDASASPVVEVIEDVEIIEEFPQARPQVETETNLFGEEITPEPPKATSQKPRKPPKKRYAPEVLMTETEYYTLVSRYGRDAADWCITKLDDYKAARGMTYKSDYRAILNWVIKEYYKENGTTTTNRQFGQLTPKEQRDIELASYIADKFCSPDTQK